MEENYTNQNNSYRFPLIVVTSLFFCFGFLTCLNDILVPHLKSFFSLNYTQATLVQFCFFSAYFFISIPSGKIVNLLGYKKGMITGLLITAMGALGFYPSAQILSYPLFLASLFVLAIGITLLQVAVNPYVTLLGPAHSSSQRLNLVQAFNSLGTTIAPTIGSMFILSSSNKPESVQTPYLIFAMSLIMIAGIISMIQLPKIKNTSEQKEESVFSLLKNNINLLKGTIGIFCYVGSEVAIGSFLINYMSLERLGSIDLSVSGKYVSFYWGAAMLGRFIGTVFLGKHKAHHVLSIAVIGSLTMTLLSLLTSGKIAVIAILSVGLFNSIMFPTIFSLSLVGLKDSTAKASGILCTAIVGGAIFPFIQGILADKLGLTFSFLIPMIGYFYILFYSIRYKSLES